MPLDADTVGSQIQGAATVAASLSASCSALLATQTANSSIPQTDQLNDDLQQAKSLASQWLVEYPTTVRAALLTNVARCASAFASAKPTIDQAAAQAATQPAQSVEEIVPLLQNLQEQVYELAMGIDSVNATLKDWGSSMSSTQSQTQSTIAQVQAAAQLEAEEIQALNQQIATMQEEIRTDRAAIAKAQSERTAGIVETVFGAILAPVTGGASLILAGIGAASIAEAQGEVSALEKSVRSACAQLDAATAKIADDQRQIALAKTLLVPFQLALDDMNACLTSLDGLRISWAALADECNGTLTKVQSAQSAQLVAEVQAWFDAACTEWAIIGAQAQQLSANLPPPVTVPCGDPATPTVFWVPLSSAPPAPPGIKFDPESGPNSLNGIPVIPVLAWQNTVYWPGDYDDNRYGMCIVATQGGQVVKQFDEDGARYVWQISVDGGNVTFYGQSDLTITVPLSSLQVSA